MIEVLLPVVMAELLVTFLLLFRTPVRKLVVMALDRLERGKGSILTKTAALTIFVVFLSTLKSIIDVWFAGRQTENAEPTGQDLMSRHLLNASLMGFILVFGVIIERLHHYIREIRLLKKVMIAGGSSNKRMMTGENSNGKGVSKHDFKAMSAEIATLKSKVRTLVSTSQSTTAAAHTDYLR